MRGMLVVLVAALAVPSIAAQTSARARLEGRVPPPAVRAVDSLVADATARALPAEMLIQKALEGGAKGVPADRIIAAVQMVSGRLGTAAEALDAAGTPRSAAGIEAGAFALTAGLGASDVRALLQSPGPDPVAVLRVAGTLSALGVPAAETVALVVSTVQSQGADLVGLPDVVQAAMARGATPAQAARLAQGRGGRGQPQGPPPDRPARPNPNRP